MGPRFDAFDAIAFLVFAFFIALAVIVVVTLGQLPGRIARKRNHPQAAAITIASWLGLATGGLLWPLALIWAFLVPIALPARLGGEQGRGERPKPAPLQAGIADAAQAAPTRRKPAELAEGEPSLQESRS